MRRRWSFVGGLLGGAAVNALTYDARYGTDTVNSAITGTFRFALKPGASRVHVDSKNGNDSTGTGTVNAPFKTVAVGWPAFQATYAYGNQFCLAGGEGQLYFDPGTLTWWRDMDGFSDTYPLVIQSYDSRDKTNESLFGWVLGAGMPILDIATTGTPFLTCGGNTGTGHYAVCGVRLRSVDANVGTPNISFIGRHNSVVFHHCTTERVTVTHQNSDGADRTNGVNFSKFVQAGQWSSGGNIGVLIGDCVDNIRIENVMSYHVGWKLGANRNATNANGGANFLSHDIYCHASNGGVTSQRTMSIMPSADGDNLRGPATSLFHASIRVPMGVVQAGFSGSQSERPGGSLQTRVNDLFIDSSPIDDGSDGEGNGGPRGYAYEMNAVKLGTTVDNVLAINNSQIGVTNNCFVNTNHLDGASVEYAFDTYCVFSRVTTVNWMNTVIKRDGSGDQTKCHPTFTNCAMDLLASGTGNIQTVATDYPGRKTNKQIYDAVLAVCNVSAGATEDISLGKIVNLVHHRPDLAGDFTQVFFDVCFPAYGKSTGYPAATLPDLSAEVPSDIFNGPTNPPSWVPSTPTTPLAYYYDISDISTLFKDTAGTVPVTADGDAVARVNDKSGNGFTITQTNGSGFCPVYRAGGGKPYLELTGASSQWLSTPGNVQAVNATDGSHTAAAAVVFTNNTGTQKVIDSDLVTRVSQFLRNNAGTLETLNFNTGGANVDNVTQAGLTAGASLRLIEVSPAAAAPTDYVNGTSATGSFFGTGPLQNAAYNLGIGAGPGGGNPMTGKLYCAVGYKGAISGADAANLDAFLAAKM
jgi:hypothetical protein